MNLEKIACTLKFLRLQKNMTQKQLASKLNLTEQAVSKWERGVGLPDISTCTLLADILGVNVEVILSGELFENEEVKSIMKDIKFFVCPVCGNVAFSTGECAVSCCGRPIEMLTPIKASDNEKLSVEVVEDENFISSNHEMTKENFIEFTAFATGETVEVVKHYPEWSLHRRIPKNRHGKLIWYSKLSGLKYQLV